MVTAYALAHQPLIDECRWYWLESHGDLGLRSNFEPIATRIGGVYGTPVTSGNLDGRLFANATRFKRVDRAIKAMPVRSVVVLNAFALHDYLGVMLTSKTAHRAYRDSRTKRSLPDWLQRMKPDDRLWVQLKLDAMRELDRALSEFDLRWMRR